MTILGVVAILGAGCLENFDHFGDFYHPKGLLLNFGSVESWFQPIPDPAKCEFLCLFVCDQVGL